jgi:L-asparaginase II
MTEPADAEPAGRVRPSEGDVGFDFVPAVVATRSGVRETLHHAAVVVLDRDGSVALAAGNPTVAIYPRSSMKPLQALAMVQLGLSVSADLLALVCASHDGLPMHLGRVRALLASVALDERSLGNTPALPLDLIEAEGVIRAGGGPSALQMNCSGKHAGMLATSKINGWALDGSYLSPRHPLQAAITASVAEVADERPSHIGIDGCGAPAHVLTLLALARAYRAVATGQAGPAGDAVYAAMTKHPEMVGGPRNGVTALMRAVPGLMAKDGADGVYAAALPDGRAVALKVADGAARARIPLLVAALGAVDVDVSAVAEATWKVPVLGHGRPVGELHPIGPLAEWWPPARS